MKRMDILREVFTLLQEHGVGRRYTTYYANLIGVVVVGCVRRNFLEVKMLRPQPSTFFTADYGDPSNLTWSNDFAVPMNVFSNNSGYDLDVMLVIVGGSHAGRAGSGGARNGGIYRGVNLEQALNTGWPTDSVYPANISTSGLASSNDGFHFVSRTPISGGNFQPYKANSGWRLSFAHNVWI